MSRRNLLNLIAALLILAAVAPLCQAQVPLAITSINPSSVVAGSPSFTLVVTGTGFSSMSQVQWNGATLGNCSLGAGTLTCPIPASLVASPGTASIRVVNPPAGTGYPSPSSNTVPFSILAPVAINAISPNWTSVGCTGVGIIILGSGFVQGTIAQGSVVQWAGPAGGQTLQPTFVSSGELRVMLPDSLLTAPGTAVIRVLNPGGVASNEVEFWINPAPVIEAITPSSVGANGPEFVLRVVGAGFLPSTQTQGSMVQWTTSSLRTSDLVTTYVSPSELRAQVPASLLAAPDSVRITVVNPPCASRSNMVMFEIVGALTINTTSLPTGVAGTYYAVGLSASGGRQPYVWSASGSLPPGLRFDASIPALSGTPTTEGSYTVTIAVRDSVGASASRDFTIRIVGALAVTTSSLPNGTAGVAYSATLAATGGLPPYSWSLAADSSLPAGLSLNASTGAISGTPTSAGTFNFNVQVSDSAKNNASRALGITVGSGLTVVTASLPEAVLNTAYSQKLLAFGGAPPYTWSLLPGASLPPGLSLTGNTGDITGTPTTAGAYNFTVQVTDAARNTATRALSITVIADLTITTASPLPAGTPGTVYRQTLAAAGGTAPYTWSATGLPAWLTLNASTGVLSGTPTAAGNYTFTIQVADSARRTASRSFTLAIAAVPPMNFSGVGAEVQPTQQQRIQVTLTAAYPAAITGRLTLTFSADSQTPIDNPEVQFATGGRTVDFTIPANGTRAQFGTAPDVGLQVGTLAGSITVTARLQSGGVDITPSPAPGLTTRINRTAPSITSVRATRTSAGLEVEIIGYATPRQVTRATFRFTAASGVTLQTPELTVDVDSAFTTWYRNTASNAFGSQFRYVQPFSVTGDATALTSVSVTLTNAIGSSSATANF